MVRNFPTRKSSHNPLLSFTFTVAFVAAVVAIISSLCGFTKKKQRTSPSTTQEPLIDEETQTLDVRIAEKTDNSHASLELPSPRETIAEPLPPPPAMGKLRAVSYHVRSSSNVSEKARLSSSMSMRSFKGYKKTSKREQKHEKNKLSHEESIWKKTIILGEKCRVPDDEEEAILYDEKGTRIPTFRRKQTTGLQISRHDSTFESHDISKENVNDPTGKAHDPYFDLPFLRSGIPNKSLTPRIQWDFTPGESFTRTRLGACRRRELRKVLCFPGSIGLVLSRFCIAEEMRYAIISPKELRP
ncbi:hypothetical protein Tco_1569470 [Tanacetum coccineum]